MHTPRKTLLRAAALMLAALLPLAALAEGDPFHMERVPDLEALPEETPMPTATPVVAPPPQVDAGVLGLPSDGRVQDSFFNDTLFVGDSVTLKLERYVRQQRKKQPKLLGGAKFFCAGSLGSGNLQEKVSAKSNHPSLKGKKMLLEDAVKASGAKKVYIMLGMNDLAVLGVDGSVESMLALLAKVRKKAPKTAIFVESATPRMKGKDQKTLNNANLEIYNRKLCHALEQGGQPGVYFVDVASALRAADGTLPGKYCSDPEGQGIHFTDEACQIWIDYLYTHTPR